MGEEQKLVSIVEEKYDSIQDDRRHFNELAMVNYLYYAGHQNLRWNSSQNRLEIQRRDGRVLRIINITNPLVLRYLQRFTARPPAFKCIPGTREREDVWAAAVSDSVLKHDMLNLGLLGQQGQNVVLSGIVFGYSLLKLFWNPGVGKMVTIRTADGGSFNVPAGDIQSCIRNPLYFARDPEATNVEEADWLMEFPIRTLKWVKQKYGVEIGSDANDSIASYQQKLKKAFITNVHFTTPIDKGDQVMVKEYWEAPSNEYPEGRVITTAAGKLLDYKERNPYGCFPYVKFGSIPMPDRFEDMSPIQMTKAAQDGYNAARAQIEEWHRRAVPKIIAPTGMIKGKPNVMGDTPFEKIEYEPGHGGVPTFVPAPSLSNEAYAFAEQYRKDMRETSGMSEVAEGQQLPNVRSADHWMAIAEQDQANMGPLLRNQASSWEKVARLILNIEQRFRVVPELIRITGRITAYRVSSFTRADLRGNVDVRIIQDSMMGMSTTARYSLTMELLKAGLWGMPKPIQMKFYEHLGAGGAFLEPFEDDELDKQTAERENAIMLSGQVPKPPAEWEDHDVHRYVLNLVRKEPSFKDLPDQVIAIFAEHDQLHAMMQAQRMGAPAVNVPAIQQAGAMQAQAGMPPRPPQPGMPMQGLPNLPRGPIAMGGQ